MSVLIQVGGFLEEPTQLLLPDTAVNDVLSIPSGTVPVTTVVGMIIVNAGASARLVDVWVTKGATDRSIFRRSVAANETVTEALSAPIKLAAKAAARKIRAQAAAANEVTITLVTTFSAPSGTA